MLGHGWMMALAVIILIILSALVDGTVFSLLLSTLVCGCILVF